MLKIKIPFGFKTLQLDNLFVLYTGKIRVKTDYDTLVNSLNHVNGLLFTKSTKGCTIISYVVTDITIHNSNIQNINSVLYTIMKDRLDLKYGQYTPTYVEYASIIEDELPF